MRYPRPPITEAVIDLQVEFGSMPPQAAFESFADRVRAELPSTLPIHFLEMGAEKEADNESHFKFRTGQTVVGIRASSPTNDRVLQIQQKGFTYSRLAPYTCWEVFSREAMALWVEFVAALRPQSVTRIAVRYINRIVIPTGKIEFADYFKVYPTIPPGVPQGVTGCFMQLVMPQEDIGDRTAAILNFAAEPNPSPSGLSFLLDFDVFREVRLIPDAGPILDILGRLRARKNELFEACITDTTRGLFQ